MDKKFFRIVLGRQHSFFQECFDSNFVGVDFGICTNLENELPENWKDFNKKFIPIYLENSPEKTRVAAGLACGAIHTLSKAIAIGDYVLCPDGKGVYKVGEISGDYFYREGPPENFLRHCRPVNWLNKSVDRSEMSEKLKNSSGSISTICDLTPHSGELNSFLEGTYLSLQSLQIFLTSL